MPREKLKRWSNEKFNWTLFSILVFISFFISVMAFLHCLGTRPIAKATDYLQARFPLGLLFFPILEPFGLLGLFAALQGQLTLYAFILSFDKKRPVALVFVVLALHFMFYAILRSTIEGRVPH